MSAWIPPLLDHLLVFFSSSLIILSIYHHFFLGISHSLRLLAQMICFLTSIPKGGFRLTGWYPIRCCNFWYLTIWPAIIGLLEFCLTMSFCYGGPSFHEDFLEHRGLRMGDEYNSSTALSFIAALGDRQEIQGGSSGQILIASSSNGGLDARYEFDKPFLATPVRRRKPDQQRMERMLLKALQRRGHFVQWDALKQPRSDIPNSNFSHKFPGISSAKASSLKPTCKTSLSRAVLSLAPQSAISPLIDLGGDISGDIGGDIGKEIITVKATSSHDVPIRIPAYECLDNIMLPMGITKGNSDGNCAAPTEPLNSFALLLHSEEASSPIAQTDVRGPFLLSTPVAAFVNKTTGAGEILECVGEVFRGNECLPEDNEGLALEHLIGKVTIDDPYAGGKEDQLFARSESQSMCESFDDRGDIIGTYDKDLKEQRGAPENVLDKSPGEKGNEELAKTEGVELPTDNHPPQESQLEFQKVGPMIQLPSTDYDSELPAVGKCSISHEPLMAENLPASCLEKTVVVAIQTHPTPKVAQRTPRHKTKKNRNVCCRLIRMTRKCGEFGHHNRRINRNWRKALRHRTASSGNSYGTPPVTAFWPREEQEGMEIEMDETLDAGAGEISGVGEYQSTINQTQTIIPYHLPVQRLGPSWNLCLQPVAGKEEAMSDVEDSVVHPTVLSLAKRKVVPDEYAMQPAQMVCESDRKIASIGHHHRIRTSIWTNWDEEGLNVSPEENIPLEGSLKRSKEHNVKVKDLALLGHENLNKLGMELQKLHNASLSRGDKRLQEELDKRSHLREQRMVRMAEKDRKRYEAMAAERLAKGPEIRGLAALMAAKKDRMRVAHRNIV